MKSDVNRRRFFRAIAAGSVGAGAAAPASQGGSGKGRPAGRQAESPVPQRWIPSPAGGEWEAIVLEKGRHLFVDDYLVAGSQNLAATLHHPRRLDKPIVLGIGSEHNNFQPFLTVLYDAAMGRFRMWYCTRKSLKDVVRFSYIESQDGIHWDAPYKELLEIYGFPFGVTDSGLDHPDPARRYKLTYWERSNPAVHYLKDGNCGVGVAFSPDGLNWTKHGPHPVSPDLWKYSVLGDPQKKGDIKWREYAANCLMSTWDPVRKLHVGYVKSWTWPPGEMGYISSSSDGLGRRLTSMTTSPDFIHWSTPARCGLPWADDFPSLEFYGCRPKPRGNQMLILTCILDETIKTRERSHGIGYTVLSTSADLVHWNRMKKPWLDRAAGDPEAADHAMAWAADLITVGDEEYLYYGAYSRGHKDFTDRTIKFARLRKDGFVSRDAGSEQGRLITPLVRLNGDKITVNANIRGDLRLRILGRDSKPAMGFGNGEVSPLKGNSTSHVAKARGMLSELKGQPVRLEFSLRDAELYAFELL